MFSLKVRDRSDSFLSMTVKCLGGKNVRELFHSCRCMPEQKQNFQVFASRLLNGNIEADASNQEKENAIATILITSHIPFLKRCFFFFRNYTLYFLLLLIYDNDPDTFKSCVDFNCSNANLKLFFLSMYPAIKIKSKSFEVITLNQN